jgi:hypothetical protein
MALCGAGRGLTARWLCCLAVAALLAGAGCAAGSPYAAGAGGGCGSAPRAVPVAALPPRLLAVSAAPGTRQAWALGERYSPARGFADYLVHFSGLAWATADTFGPEAHRGSVSLAGVSAISGGAAWVWGSYQPGPDPLNTRPFLALVSGGAVHQVRAALLGDVYVWALASDGTADTWLVGGARSSTGRFLGVVAARWDGTSWHQVRAPQGVDGLTSLSTPGRTDAWVAQARSGLLRWNGAAWSMSYQAPASLTTAGAAPAGMVVAASSGQAWVVYNQLSTNDPESGPGPPARAHSAYFDGHAWHTVPVPSRFSELTAVTMAGPDAWAIGDADMPRILHSRMGGGWCTEPALPLPRNRGCSPRPSALSAASPRYVIVVSSSTSVGCHRSLAYVYDGRRWQSVNPAPAG